MWSGSPHTVHSTFMTRFTSVRRTLSRRAPLPVVGMLRARALARWRNVAGGATPTLSSLIRDFPDHGRSLFGSRSPLDLRIPWMPFVAVRQLQGFVPPYPSVVEFGVGGSTLWWLDRGAKLTSIEHDATWARTIRDQVTCDLEAHWTLILAPPNEDSGVGNAGAHPYSSTDERYRGYSFERYVRSIEHFADESLDVVVVDGRARPACVRAASAKVRIGGLLVVDQSEREEYWGAIGELAGGHYSLQQFSGPTPGLSHFTQTAIMQRQH